jgi:hypothetical protein
MTYLAVSRKSPWGQVSFLETWRLRVAQSPWEWVLLGLAGFLFVRVCSIEIRRLVMPAVVYAGLMILVVLRVNTDTPRYLLPFLPALQFASGIVFAAAAAKWRWRTQVAAAVVFCSLILGNTASQMRAHPIRPAPSIAANLRAIGDLKAKTLLVPQYELPMIHYYFPELDLWGYADDTERATLAARLRFDGILR